MSRRHWALELLLFVCVVLTLLVYVILVPRHGVTESGVVYFVLGWVPFTLSWYAAGRRFGQDDAAPSMRPVDFGAGIVVLALLISIAFDAWGFSPTQVPEGHVIQALSMFIGLALFGWGIGRRSATLDYLATRNRKT